MGSCQPLSVVTFFRSFSFFFFSESLFFESLLLPTTRCCTARPSSPPGHPVGSPLSGARVVFWTAGRSYSYKPGRVWWQETIRKKKKLCVLNQGRRTTHTMEKPLAGNTRTGPMLRLFGNRRRACERERKKKRDSFNHRASRATALLGLLSGRGAARYSCNQALAPVLGNKKHFMRVIT